MAASDAELKIIASLDDKVTEAVRKLIGEVGTLSDEAKDAFDEMRAAAERAKGSTEGAADAVEEVGKSARKAGSDLKSAGEDGARGFADIKDKIKDVAVGLFGLQSAIQIFKQSITDAINTGLEVDVLNARIQNFTRASGQALQVLTDDLKTLSLANKQFVKEQEVSAAALILLKDGFSSTATVVFDVAEALAFARTNGISLTDATRLLAEANKSLGDGTKNSVQLFSRLNFLFGKGFDDANALAGALSALSNTARQSGLKLDDAAASLATLSETSSAREALRNLEVILKTLQARAPEVNAAFRATGQQFDETTVATAGLRNTLATLVQSIAASGGDAQTELKKLFGSQEAVNAVLVLGSQEAKTYSKNVLELGKSTQKLARDTNNVLGAQEGFLGFLMSEGNDVIGNTAGAYRSLNGATADLLDRTRAFTRAKTEEAQAVRISTGEVTGNAEALSQGIDKIRSAADTFGGSDVAPKLEAIGQGFRDVALIAAETVPAVAKWYETVSGQVVDPEVAAISNRIEGLIEQARKFSEIGVEGFVGEGLEARLREIADFELLLLDELNIKREASRQAQLDKDRAAADEKAARDLRLEEEKRRQEEQTILLRQQAELQAYQANLQRIRETAALAQQLVQEGIAGGAGERQFFADIAEQVQPFASKILELEGLLANTILSEAEARTVQERIEQLKLKVREIASESAKGGKAFDKGLTDSLRDFVDVASNDYKNGTALATASTNAFTSSFSGLLNDIVLGTKSAGEAFKDFIRNFISGLVQAINQLIATKIAAGILSALVPGFAAAPAAPVAAAGGVVGGRLLATGPAGSGPFNGPPVGGAKFFEKGGIMAGTMLAAASGLPMRAYAQGGVATEPQIAVFGEGRGAEAFVPLPGPNRGIPVEFQNTPAAMAREQAQMAAPSINVQVDYNPSIQALDGRSTRDVLLREARAIGDIVAGEIASGANRGLIESVRAKR